MKGATLFSGIGAPECAAPGINWLWGAEIDRFASAVHAARVGTPNLGDVTAHDFIARAESVVRPDLLVFGSPCQDFSIAGKRLGLDGARGNMALVALSLAARLRPRWLVFENVPGLLSSADGRDFGLFLRTVEECGYLGAWRILNAEYWGVPQRRRRLFFVGYLGDWQPSAAVLFEPESLRGDPAPRREARQDTAPTLSARPTGGGGLGTDFDCDGGLILNGLDGASHALTARHSATGRYDPNGETFLAHAIQAGALRDNPSSGPDGAGFKEECAFTLEARAEVQIVAHAPAIAFDSKASGRNGFGIGPISPTLRAMGHKDSHTNAGGQVAIQQASGVRRLTPKECARLQGFPDEWCAITYRGKPAADGPQYKALGNAMAVPVLRWILDRIVAVDDLKRQTETA